VPQQHGHQRFECIHDSSFKLICYRFRSPTIEGGGTAAAEEAQCTDTRQLLGDTMRKDKDEQAEIEAAMERLKGFIKKAVNYHDPERMRRVTEGREHAPRGGWAELARAFRRM
jgi:hypothetical protein